MSEEFSLKQKLIKEIEIELENLTKAKEKLGEGDSDVLDNKLDNLEQKINKLKALEVSEEEVKEFEDALDKIK